MPWTFNFMKASIDFFWQSHLEQHRQFAHHCLDLVLVDLGGLRLDLKLIFKINRNENQSKITRFNLGIRHQYKISAVSITNKKTETNSEKRLNASKIEKNHIKLFNLVLYLSCPAHPERVGDRRSQLCHYYLKLCHFLDLLQVF